VYPQGVFRQALRLGLVVTLTALLALSASGADPQRPPLPSTKIIALTFDDGPDPANTPKILDILQRHNVKATFFVEGQKADDYPYLIWREYQEGHMVGNHSYTHPRLATLSSAEVEKELRDTNTAITSVGVPQPNLFRPPSGSTDAQVKSIAATLGMTQTLWAKTQRTADWKKPMGPPEELCGGMVRDAKPGAIIVLHDWTTSGVDALECIITRLMAKGYSFGLIYPSAKYNSLNRSYVELR
jgi:peptidoglycan/xylan/chitin deacetylase (PgdA/CDA1 family)